MELEKLLDRLRMLFLSMDETQDEIRKATEAIQAEIQRQKTPAGPQPAGTRSR